MDPGSTCGHEQSGERPGLIVSTDLFNHGPSGLVIILPITTKDKNISSHVEVNPPEGGLEKRSFILCEHIRAISKNRLSRYLGQVSSAILSEVEDRLRILQSL